MVNLLSYTERNSLHLRRNVRKGTHSIYQHHVETGGLGKATEQLKRHKDKEGLPCMPVTQLKVNTIPRLIADNSQTHVVITTFFSIP